MGFKSVKNKTFTCIFKNSMTSMAVSYTAPFNETTAYQNLIIPILDSAFKYTIIIIMIIIIIIIIIIISIIIFTS